MKWPPAPQTTSSSAFCMLSPFGSDDSEQEYTNLSSLENPIGAVSHYWQCSYCKSRNLFSHSQCTQCGGLFSERM